MNAVILLGPPGAGKGTVAGILVDHGCEHVSTGQLLRNEIAKGTPLGREAKALIDRGQFVSDETVVGMVSDLFDSAASSATFVFDGFPRTLVQAEELDRMLHSLDGQVERVVLMDCPDEVIVERLSGRRTCKKCGRIYHLAYNPPVQEDHCDTDGCELVQRPDDTSETVRNRLRVYVNQTEPLVQFYETKGLIERIDATQSIEDVRVAVAEKLG